MVVLIRFSCSDLEKVGESIRNQGYEVELYDISAKLPGQLQVANAAATLVIRNGAALLLGNCEAADALFAEQESISYDTKYFDPKKNCGKGRTLNKRARYNVVFGESEQKPSADYRQCTIHSFAKLPKLEAFRNALPHTLGEKAGSLNAEGNKYYEANSGIGFHGDSERKIVVCLSLGKDSMLRYHWRLPRSSHHELEPTDILIRHGDVYVMSEKATGFDWRSSSKVRVVHAAGADKYLNPA